MSDTIKHKRPPSLHPMLLGFGVMPGPPPPPLSPDLSAMSSAERKSQAPWLYPLTVDEQWLLREREQEKRNAEREKSWRERSRL